jgi:hypothetical protein
MESNIKSSFIPRDTVAPASGARRRYGGGGGADLLVLFSIVLLVASMALGVGVFLYVTFLESSLKAKADNLERAQASFEPQLIAELNRLDERMKSGEELLEAHVAPSALFHTLEQLTLGTIAFRNMRFDAAEQGKVLLDMTGYARSVNSIALQADLFGKHGAIVSPIFSSINREEQGVRFSLAAQVNPSALRYATLIREAQAAAAGAAAIPAGPPPDQAPDSIPLFAP